MAAGRGAFDIVITLVTKLIYLPAVAVAAKSTTLHSKRANGTCMSEHETDRAVLLTCKPVSMGNRHTLSSQPIGNCLKSRLVKD